MADEKVYSGSADLNVDPFVKALGRMETSITETAGKIEQALQTIENSLSALAGSSVGSANSIVTNLAQARGAFTGVATSATQSANAVTAAAKAQQTGVKMSLNEMVADARAWKANLAAQSAEAAANFGRTAEKYQQQAKLLAGISDPGALTKRKDLADDQVTKQAQLAEDAAARVIAAKQNVARAAEAVAAAVKAADAQQILDARKVLEQRKIESDQAQLAAAGEMARLKQMQGYRDAIAARQKEVAKEGAAAVRASTEAAQKGAAADKQIAAQKIADTKEVAALTEMNNKNVLADEKAMLDSKLAYNKQMLDRNISLLRSAGAQEIALVREQINAQIQLYEQRAAKAQQIARAQTEKTVVSKIRMDEAKVGGNDRAYVDAQKAYQAAVLAAKQAEQEEISAQRHITEFKKAGRKAEAAAANEAARVEEAAAKQASEQGSGMWASLSKEMRRAGEEIKTVENRYNSLFRAGSQISSIGKQMTFFSALVTGAGVAAKNSAEDFDFWVRRVEAAANSAGSAWTDKTQSMNEAIQQTSFELAREVGTDNFSGIAEALYVYQSAAGSTINTVEDLRVVQEGLTKVMQVSTITGDDYATTTRGMLAVMSQFQLPADQMSHAMEVILNVTQQTQSEVPDMFEAFKYVGTLAKEMGLDVEDTAAIFGRLADYGLKGSQAGRGFQQVIDKLADPTKESDAALQKLLITNEGLKGSWTDILRPGGNFLQLLDKTNEDGTKTAGVFHVLADALKDYNPEDMMAFLGDMFGDSNEMRTILPLLRDQINAINGVADAAGNVAPKIEDIADGFRNSAAQSKLFDSQWKTIEGSIRVEFGRAMGDIKKNFITLGTAVAEVMLPMLKSIGSIINKVMEWASANEGTAKTILKIIGYVAMAAAVFGPLLIAFGAIVQSFGAFPVVAAAVTSGFGAISRLVAGLIPLIAGLSAPMLAALAVVTFLGFAWANNWLGMRDVLEKFMSGAGGNIVAFFGGVFDALKAIFSGDGAALNTALGTMLGNMVTLLDSLGSVLWTAATRAFGGLVTGAVDGLKNLGTSILSSISTTIDSVMGQLKAGLNTWGWNLVVSLGTGILNGTFGIIPGVMTSLGNTIAGYLRSFSPPKVGPLRGIFIWGQNLIKTFAEGMNAADISDVESSVDRIAEAMKDSFAAGTSSGVFLDGAKLINEKVLEMFAIIKTGGQISDTFFDQLTPYLGRWYADIEKIMLKYQEVYALESGIRKEEQRLAVLKAQREELKMQLDLRTAAFSIAVDPTGPAYYKQYEKDMVDPTTDEGKNRIEAMRASLSKEDFQSWISFQKKLWESRHKEEDGVLKIQEDTIALSVKAQEKQLALVKEQYDTYVALYEYALKLANLEKDDPTKTAGGGGGGGGSNSMDDSAGDADLEAARRRARGITGEDQQLKDEKTIRDERGGDIEAVGGADEQAKREAKRNKDLDAENRRAKADFDVRKIQAKGDEEKLAQIKREEEAWNAAYREEKARIQDRAAYAKEVSDAAAEAADVTEPIRTAEQRAEFAAQIAKSMGEQPEHIATANELKEQSGSLDEAAVASQTQLRTEERKLSDLRELDGDKRLEFEDRIKAAGNNEEEIRRIKEEQSAWESAYKAALDAQEARTKAARQADQDLNDAQQAERNKGGAGGGGKLPAPDKLPGPPTGGLPGGDGGVYQPPKDELPGADGDSGATKPAVPSDPEHRGSGNLTDAVNEGEKTNRQNALGPDAPNANGSDEPVVMGDPGKPWDNALLGLEEIIGHLPGTADNTPAKLLDKQYDKITGADTYNGVTGQYGDDDGSNGFWDKVGRGLDRVVEEGILNAGAKYNPWNDNVNNVGTGAGGTGAAGAAQAVADAKAAATGANFDELTAGANLDGYVKILDGLGAKFGDKYVSELMGAGGPYATSEFTLQKVNGVWTRVLRDDAGNPSAVTEAMLTDLNGKFYTAFTGEKGPAKTTEEALQKVGEAFYVRLTGEGSPPKTVADMVNKVGENAYKLLTGATALPATVDQMVSDVGTSSYKLLTGKDAPSTVTGDFVEDMKRIYKELGIEGPLPTTVQGGVDAIGKAILEKMSPTGTLPTTVAEGARLMGEDFLKALSPTGTIPATVDGAMTLLGTTVTRGMTGEGGLTTITQGAVDAVTSKFKHLQTGENNLGDISGGTVDSIREKYTGLKDAGPIQSTDEMLSTIKGYYEKAKSGEQNIPGLVDQTVALVTGSFLKAKEGETSLPVMMQATMDAVKSKLGTGLNEEGGVKLGFFGMVNEMVAKANTDFGAQGSIANKFGEAANSMATAAAKAAAAAAAAASGANVPANKGGSDGGNYAGLDDTGGSEEQPQWRKLHGKEAVLEAGEDAPTFRALKQTGIWKALTGAIISSKGTASTANLLNSPAARSARPDKNEADRSTMPTKDGGLTVINRNSTVNVNRIDARNPEEARRLMKQVAKAGTL